MDTKKLLLLFLLCFSLSFADELKIKAPIIIKPDAKIVWSPNIEPDINFYTVYYKVGGQWLNTIVNDTTFSKTFTTIQLDSSINRVFFYVTATNPAGQSLPSDTVNYIYSGAPVLFGDYDRSGIIDGLDAMMFWNSFGNPEHYDVIFDANLDGKIDGLDHIYFVENYRSEL